MDNSDRPATIRRYRHLATLIVEKHFGQPPSRIVYKRSGLTNFVFAINHVEGQFVVRISPEPDKIEAFKKELWATQKVREAGVPSPEVLAVGNDLIAEPYMISRRVTGSEATHHPKRDRIVHEMGRYAQIINSIPTKHFGKNFDWTTNKPKLSTWSNFIDEERELDERIQLFSELRILSKRELKHLRKIVDESRTLRTKPSLNHSDLRLKNVIVDDDGEIAAIIDWEECLSVIAPQWELSISLHDLSIDEKHLFLEGYGLSPEQAGEMSPLIKALNILNYRDAITHAIEKDDQKTLANIKLRLTGALDLYMLPD
jgi:aminoglycoside phosphotransferase (APT) family kinase protein